MLKSNIDVGNCAVCNEIASGIHYGVPTCEGCKGFFRRIITTCASDNNTLNCSGPLKNQCTVAFRVRNLCQRCRLQKCFNAGMTRKHSKLGRKRKVEQEILFESQKVSNLEVLLTDEEMNVKIKTENLYFLREIGIISKEDADNRNLAEVDNESHLIHSNSHCDLPSSDLSWTTEQEMSYSVTSDAEKHSDDYYLFSPTLANFWKQKGKPDMVEELSERTRLLFPLMRPLIQMHDEDIEDLFIKINNFFYLMDPSDLEYKTFQVLRKEIPIAHMETCIVTLPVMENFFNLKYDNIVTDNDPDNVWKIVLKDMDKIINNVISFSRRIPDFESVLPRADTVNIIKLSLFEIISLRFVRLVDLENNQFIDPGLTRKIPSAVMAKSPLGPLFLRYFYVVAFIKKYLVQIIDDYEMAFLSALCLTLPGWDSTQSKFINPAYFNRMRFYFSLCLYDHLIVRRFKGNVNEKHNIIWKNIIVP